MPYSTAFRPPPKPPDVQGIHNKEAKKLLNSDSIESVALLRFHDTTLTVFINSLNTNPPDPQPPDTPPEPTPPNFKSFVPEKYLDYAETVFNPTEFEKLPEHRPFDVDIELEEGKTPPFQRMYQLLEAERDAVSEYVNSNLKQGHIQRSTSSAGAPVLFIRKKSGVIHLCVDFRGLNAITKKNRFPLPLVNDLLERFRGCCVFTVMDLTSAYSHLWIREGDEWKTAFRTHLGLFEHLIIPYGLTNAPAAWQAFIQDVLSDLLDIVCIVYIDDILIFSKTQEEHGIHVKLVLDRLCAANLCANASKCHFDQTEVEYLGFIINSDGIKMNPKKLEMISEWPQPQKLKELQGFLGFTNFYRRFIEKYSNIIAPLTRLSRKDVPFIWSTECKTAFETLKTRFLQSPVLRHFDPKLPITVATDGSDFAISGTVQQPDDNSDLHPVAYFS